MSLLSNYAENHLADKVRGQAWTLPASLYAGLASEADDGSITELSGTGYACIAIARSLSAWAGTQAPGSTLASTGTSHATSNNALVNWGVAGSDWGEASHVVLFDASTSGNAIAYIPLPSPVTINTGDPVTIAAGALTVTLGLAGGCSDYLANKLIDFLFRGQAYSFPATMYAALFTAAPTGAGGGAEVPTGSGYARVGIAGTLAAWSGTQGAGTTVASSGTSGRISNNAAVTFGAPTASWGRVTHDGLYDAATLGNLLFYAPLANAKDIYAGGAAPSFDAGSWAIEFA
jgi:hypothetical protein